MSQTSQNLSLSQLAALVGGQFPFVGNTGQTPHAQGELLITGVAGASEAGPTDVTFLGNGKYLPALKHSNAGVALVPLDFNETVPPLLIRVENPSLEFAKLVAHFAPKPIEWKPSIHPTAVLDRNTRSSPCSVSELKNVGSIRCEAQNGPLCAPAPTGTARRRRCAHAPAALAQERLCQWQRFQSSGVNWSS